jgi:hypothetical protein
MKEEIKRIEAAISLTGAYENALYPVQCSEMLEDVRSLIAALEQAEKAVVDPIGKNYINIALDGAEVARLELADLLQKCKRSPDGRQTLLQRQQAAQRLRQLAKEAVDANIALLQDKPPLRRRPHPDYLRLVPRDEEQHAAGEG